MSTMLHKSIQHYYVADYHVAYNKYIIKRVHIMIHHDIHHCTVHTYTYTYHYIAHTTTL